MNIILINVYDFPGAVEFLYEMLGERDDTINISHREMPTFEQHKAFVEGHPYKRWLLVVPGDGASGFHPVGQVYLTHQNEIGIFIKKEEQRKGYGKAAVSRLIISEPDTRLFANINPQNAKSISLFDSLGFNLIQHTLSRP